MNSPAVSVLSFARSGLVHFLWAEKLSPSCRLCAWKHTGSTKRLTGTALSKDYSFIGQEGKAMLRDHDFVVVVVVSYVRRRDRSDFLFLVLVCRHK